MELELSKRGVRDLARSVSGVLALWRYFNERFDDGTLRVSDTILGRMLAADDEQALSRIDLFFNTLLLLIAGNETTTNLLGGIFDTMIHNPEQYQLIRDNPDLINSAVEEQLRFSSPIQLLYRTAREDYPSRLRIVTEPEIGVAP